MSDITMCKGTNCPIKEQCKRYLSTPNDMWQSYFTEPPFTETPDSISCEYFWRIKTPILTKNQISAE